MWDKPQALLVALADLVTFVAAIADANGNPFPTYSPLRPPAVPLAVRNPYTSAWSSTGGSLNSGMPMFWNGDAIGWIGIVTVDGISYDYLGNGVQILPEIPNYHSAEPKTVTFDSQYSNFTFIAGPVTVFASFLSPVLPTDTCRSSIPLSYLTTSIRSNDNQTHNVQFYSEVNAAWISASGDGSVEWDVFKNTAPINGTANVTTNPDTLYSWIYHPRTQVRFSEQNDYPQWGNFSYTTAPMGAKNFSYQSGYALDLRYNYILNHTLANNVDSNYRGSGSREAIFAFAHDFGLVSSAKTRYTIGSIQDPIIRYLYQGGVTSLQPLWRRCYIDQDTMIAFHWHDFEAVQVLSNQFESQLRADINHFYLTNSTSALTPGSTGPDSPGSYVFNSADSYGFLDPKTFNGIPIPDISEANSYYPIVALSARQIMGAYVFAVQPPPFGHNDPAFAPNEPLMFQKEISSDGKQSNMHTN
jgi:hypothetical protein